MCINMLHLPAASDIRVCIQAPCGPSASLLVATGSSDLSEDGAEACTSAPLQPGTLPNREQDGSLPQPRTLPSHERTKSSPGTRAARSRRHVGNSQECAGQQPVGHCGNRQMTSPARINSMHGMQPQSPVALQPVSNSIAVPRLEGPHRTESAQPGRQSHAEKRTSSDALSSGGGRVSQEPCMPLAGGNKKQLAGPSQQTDNTANSNAARSTGSPLRSAPGQVSNAANHPLASSPLRLPQNPSDTTSVLMSSEPDPGRASGTERACRDTQGMDSPSEFARSQQNSAGEISAHMTPDAGSCQGSGDQQACGHKQGMGCASDAAGLPSIPVHRTPDADRGQASGAHPACRDEQTTGGSMSEGGVSTEGLSDVSGFSMAESDEERGAQFMTALTDVMARRRKDKAASPLVGTPGPHKALHPPASFQLQQWRS